MIRKMEVSRVVDGLQINNKVEFFCHGCAHGKNHKKSFLEMFMQLKTYEP
jgi:hypothetical protein